jgi:hypothetical protein
MSLVRAYHAGYASEIRPFLEGSAGLAESQSQRNWLGRGVYFWESDHRRAEKWAARNDKEMILEPDQQQSAASPWSPANKTLG